MDLYEIESLRRCGDCMTFDSSHHRKLRRERCWRRKTKASPPFEAVGRSRRDAMFIESSSPLISASPFMGERRLVTLRKELMNLNWACLSINIAPLRGFSDRVLLGCAGRVPTVRDGDGALHSTSWKSRRTSLAHAVVRLGPFKNRRTIKKNSSCQRRLEKQLHAAPNHALPESHLCKVN